MSSLETITVYRDSYEEICDKNYEQGKELAVLRGTIQALAEMDESPEFVFKQLKELVQNFK